MIGFVPSAVPAKMSLRRLKIRCGRGSVVDRQTDAEVTGDDGQASNRCEISVIIPALKEAERINPVVEHVLNQHTHLIFQQ